MNRKYLQKFQIKDVVFLAIMSAVALATCAVMPLVISLQPLIFGISQLVTALQIGVFFAIGLYKVRKPGSLLLMALMMGLIQLMMSPPMFLSSVLNGVLIELIVLLLFRGYEKDAAVFCAAAGSTARQGRRYSNSASSSHIPPRKKNTLGLFAMARPKAKVNTDTAMPAIGKRGCFTYSFSLISSALPIFSAPLRS